MNEPDSAPASPSRMRPFADRIPPAVRRKFLAIAKHEAGHFVIGITRGFEPTACKVTFLNAHGSHHGEAEFKPKVLREPTLESVRNYLEDRVTMLFAGQLAEHLEAGRVLSSLSLDELREAVGNSDGSKIGELIFTLANLETCEDRSEPYLIRIASPLRQKAMDEVEAHSATIEEIAHKLLARFAGYVAACALTPDEIEAYRQKLAPAA